MLTIFLFSTNSYCQKYAETKAQASKFLSKSYYSINFGGIFYPFSNTNLIDGYKTDTYSKNSFSGRLLLGYKITTKFGGAIWHPETCFLV
jgi:hypothetical protein